MTNHRIYLIFISLTLLVTSSCQPRFNTQITEAELKSTIQYLASDDLKGRFPGTDEDQQVASYIARCFDRSGLVLMAEEGIQSFQVSRGYRITDKNAIYSDPEQRLSDSDFSMLGFSSSDTITAVVTQLASWDSVVTGTKGKIALLSYPENLSMSAFDMYKELRTRCLTLADSGAIAVLIVCNEGLPEVHSDQRLPLSIPVALITLEGLEKLQSGHQPDITIISEVLPGEILTENTVARLKGSDPSLAGQYVIVGAHHDHLGMGGRGSSSRRQDTIAVHYGADDNASGVAGVIELAQYEMSKAPRRSMLFLTFGSEELGLQGSRYFADHPVIELDSVQAMINLDMIGRLNESRSLQIGGVGTSPVMKPLIDSINTRYNFSISYSDAGYGPSDHSSFYAKDIPVLFISTGAHPDYHTPEDKAEKINYEGLAEVTAFVAEIADSLATMKDKIPFTEAGPKEASGSRGHRGGVTFGLMPDVMYDGNEGMPVSFVTPGKPAAIGGIQGGDIIVAVDGKHVGNVQDYMMRLAELKEGQSVVVTVKRKEESIELLLKL